AAHAITAAKAVTRTAVQCKAPVLAATAASPLREAKFRQGRHFMGLEFFFKGYVENVAPDAQGVHAGLAEQNVRGVGPGLAVPGPDGQFPAGLTVGRDDLDKQRLLQVGHRLPVRRAPDDQVQPVALIGKNRFLLETDDDQILPLGAHRLGLVGQGSPAAQRQQEQRSHHSGQRGTHASFPPLSNNDGAGGPACATHYTPSASRADDPKGPCPETRPCTTASRTSCVRFSTCSLDKMLFRWFLTVFSEMPSRAATSRLVSPRATHSSTSRSRGVRGSGGQRRAGGAAWASSPKMRWTRGREMGASASRTLRR